MLVIAVRSCLAQSATRAEQQRQRALDGPVASFADAGGEKEARGAALPAPHDADDSPDERTLYACTGHSVAEVRSCEAAFSEHAVVDSPLSCHSVASGLPRANKSICVHLIIRADSPLRARSKACSAR